MAPRPSLATHFKLPSQPRPFRPTGLVRRRIRALGYPRKYEWLTANLGHELGYITPESLQPCSEPVTSAGGFELLGSYSWGRPSSSSSWRVPRAAHLLVPGEAPRIVAHRVPHVAPVWVARDEGGETVSYRDVNAAFLPRWPFEPMLRAVGIMRPGFRFDEVDLIVNRSILSSMLRLASDRTVKDATRMELVMVNNTLVATPIWKRVSDEGNYGRIFEEVFTQHTKAMLASQSHHRAILYALGPLKVAVLYEVDAAFDASAPDMVKLRWKSGDADADVAATPASQSQADSAAQTSAEEKLFAAIDDKHVAASVGWSPISRAGRGTVSARTAEMTTTTKTYRPYEKFEQMWLGRTPYLFMSTHVENTFTGIRAEHLGPALQKFEVDRQEDLQKLVTALKMLKHFTAKSPMRHVIALCTRLEHKLRVFEPKERRESPIPKALRSRLWDIAVHEEPARSSTDAGPQPDPCPTTERGSSSPRESPTTAPAEPPPTMPHPFHGTLMQLAKERIQRQPKVSVQLNLKKWKQNVAAQSEPKAGRAARARAGARKGDGVAKPRDPSVVPEEHGGVFLGWRPDVKESAAQEQRPSTDPS